MKHATVEGLSLEYREVPAVRPGAPAILLLHEGLGCAALWGRFPDRLAEATGCRVVAGSRAGYGGSQPYAAARTPRYLHREALEALPAFTGALGLHRPILVGHSEGGSIALLHAAAFPERVLAVAVMAPHAFVQEEALAGIRKAVTAWGNTDLPARLARHHADAPRVFHDWSGTWLSPAFHPWSIEAEVAAIRCPLLVIQGEEDEYASLRHLERIAQLNPATRLLPLPACGHAPHKDQPAAVLAALQAFVAEAF